MLVPISDKTSINFVNALTGPLAHLNFVEKKYPKQKFLSLGASSDDFTYVPDYKFLKSLEAQGVPTIRSMILGDPYLRYLPPNKALGYATHIGKRLAEIFCELKPNVVMASNDRLHSAMALAVAKIYNIPFVALAFTAIPNNRTWFINSLTPESLIPLKGEYHEDIRAVALAVFYRFKNSSIKVQAYQAPFEMFEYANQLIAQAKNAIKRTLWSPQLGIDEYSAPSLIVRCQDILRRLVNRLVLPERHMLRAPPSEQYAYYPFHMSPESMVDTWAPYYQDQIAFIRQLAMSIPVDLALVVKLHFSDPDNYNRKELMGLMKIPRVHVVHPTASGSLFLKSASLVVGITGTSNIESALHGKPTLIFGDSPYVHFPRSERAMRPDQIHSQIISMLNKLPPTDEEIINALAVYMNRYKPGRVNDWSIPLSDDDLNLYSECFISLIKIINTEDSQNNWYKKSPFTS